MNLPGRLPGRALHIAQQHQAQIPRRVMADHPAVE
jgi:hypothetical protein